MTAKEDNAEMLDIFEHKHALTEKINHNSALVNRYEIAAENESDDELRLEYELMAIRGRKLVSAQATERNKLTAEKIGKQLGMTKATVIYRYRVYEGSRL